MFPWRIWLLLTQRNEAFAAGLLAHPRYTLDAFSQHLFNLYGTVPLLLSEECLQLLSGLACLLQLTTFHTECHHSGNLRRAKMRAQATRLDTAQLAQRHVASSTLPWMKKHVVPAPPKMSAKRKRGRPLRQPVQVQPVVAQQVEGVPAVPVQAQQALQRRPKRRRGGSGGGGAARAFCHFHTRGLKWTSASMRQVWADYRTLSQEQRQFYVELLFYAQLGLTETGAACSFIRQSTI